MKFITVDIQLHSNEPIPNHKHFGSECILIDAFIQSNLNYPDFVHPEP